VIDRELRSGDVDVWISLEPAETSDVVVHQVLERYPGVSGPEAWYVRDAGGRPAVHGYNDLSISVSHTDGALLVALGIRCRLGVDVEPVRDRGVRSLRQHALAGSELDELERHGSLRRNEVFLRYWTRKEALLKAAGAGLAVEPRLIELPSSGSSPHPIAVPATLGHPGDWWMVELDLAGYAAAVAVDQPAPRVRLLPLAQARGGPRPSPVPSALPAATTRGAPGQV
jgi:phosphopantetheinyl transferase